MPNSQLCHGITVTLRNHVLVLKLLYLFAYFLVFQFGPHSNLLYYLSDGVIPLDKAAYRANISICTNPKHALPCTVVSVLA